MNGTGTVRSMAALYGELACGGARLGITDATRAELEAPAIASPDLVLKVETAFALGFMKPFPILPFGSTRAYGHTGSGGSFAYADPDRRLGYAYAMNRAGYGIPTDPRELALRRAVESAVAARTG